MDGRANPLLNRKVVAAVFFEVVAVVTAATAAGCSVVQRSVAVVVYSCSCSCSLVVI